MTGPLEGLRVLDLTRLLPGGYATLLLADLGADVIKVEEPERGDYIRWSPPMVGDHSAAHVALNRNKRSITLNLKQERGRALLARLATEADVLVESFRPGVMSKLGVGEAKLRAANPRLVYCAITGYGQNGPRAGVAGHDLNYLGYSGALDATGEAGGPPVIPAVQIGDLAGGGMFAVIAILSALHRRTVTGQGDFCDVAMTDGIVSWLSIHAASFFATGQVPGRGDMPLTGAFPCYRVYRAADGFITLGALEPRFWSALCTAIGREDLMGDAYAVGQRRDHVIVELDALFSKKTRAEWMAELDGVDACVGPVLDFAEAFADPQVGARAMVFDADVAGSDPMRHVGNPLKLQGATVDSLRRPPPGLGEHTGEVLAEVGVDERTLAELRTLGAV